METDAGIAILGGPGFLSEALIQLLGASDTPVIGAYAELADLQAALGSAGEGTAVVVDADDPAAGPAAVASLRRSHPCVRLILLCEELSPAVQGSALRQSVEGVVMKSDGPQELLLAVRHVLEGRSVLPAGWYEAAAGASPAARLLSPREEQVLELAALGRTNAQIAEELVISINTVKFHLRSIYAQLGAHNRVQAANAVRGEG